MKHIILIAWCTPVMMCAQIDIPNGQFETWDLYNTWTLEPQYWTTPNNQLTVSVLQDSASFEGELAMKVKVQPGFEGGIPQSASTFFAVTDLPNELQFAVKASVPDGVEQDKVEVKIEYLNEDAIVYTNVWQSFESIPDWQMINLELESVEEEVDEIRIEVSAGFTDGLSGGSWDTWISMDAMEFVISNSVIELPDEPQLIYPNPVESILHIDRNTAVGAIRIEDVCGRVVLEYSFANAIDISLLTPGMYFISVGSARQKFLKQ